MSTQISRLTAGLDMSDLLNSWPETVPSFLCHRKACVGRPMSRFKTIEGAVAVYGLARNSFVGEL